MTQIPVKEEGAGIKRHFEREAAIKATNTEVDSSIKMDPPTDSSQDDQKIQN